MSNKFKVGDRVKVNIGHGVKKGIIIKIDRYDDGMPYRVELKNGTMWADGDSLELIRPAPVPDTQLDTLTSQELVDIANKGFDALRVLRERGDAEVKNIGPWSKVNALADYKARLKPKPAFEPYTIESTGWEVKYIPSVNDIAIGCKPFPVVQLQAALRALLDGDAYVLHARADGVPVKAQATRKGIEYVGNVLPWADAEKLYEKIKEL